MNQDRIPWSEKEIRTARSRLLAFYGERRRSLPWRAQARPYQILVAEVMSQQTRMETVVPYYRRWMERFPDPGSLASADEEEVLSLWEGLGYYSRARNLHRTARELEDRYDGRVPSDPDELQTLPGVGPYTAGAVASIAFGVPVPAVDGNVRRVLARLTDRPRPGGRELQAWAAALVDPQQPGAFNQALMELGSQVCTPRSPACGECPVAELCRARAAGSQENRPAPRSRRPVPKERVAVAVLVARGVVGEPRFLMRRRPSRGLLGGMWEFPGVVVGEDSEARDELDSLLLTLGLGQAPKGCEPAPSALPGVDHAFSHLKVEYLPFLVRLQSGQRARDGRPEQAEGGGVDGTDRELRWLGPRELPHVPVPVAQRKILRHAETVLGSF